MPSIELRRAKVLADRAAGLTIKELAHKHNVSEPTIKGDIRAIRADEAADAAAIRAETIAALKAEVRAWRTAMLESAGDIDGVAAANTYFRALDRLGEWSGATADANLSTAEQMENFLAEAAANNDEADAGGKLMEGTNGETQETQTRGAHGAP